MCVVLSHIIKQFTIFGAVKQSFSTHFLHRRKEKTWHALFLENLQFFMQLSSTVTWRSEETNVSTPLSHHWRCEVDNKTYGTLIFSQMLWNPLCIHLFLPVVFSENVKHTCCGYSHFCCSWHAHYAVVSFEHGMNVFHMLVVCYCYRHAIAGSNFCIFLSTTDCFHSLMSNFM